MGNLKDINYGIPKYLELSDASSIPDIGTNRKNLDLLNFKVATNNAYALYNFKDGMIDAYQTEDGVDTSTSTNEIYNSAGEYYTGETTVTSGVRESITSTPGSGTWIAPAGATSVEVLVVGGGGGSGSAYGSSGGGGAGGVVYHASKSVTALSSYTLTIGAGGTCTASGRGTNGTNSVFSDITALGGGGGGGRNAPQPGLSGGSGGGGGTDGGGGTVYAGGSGTQGNSGGGTGYGNDGGSGSHVSGVWEGGGGGGGAGAAGGNGHRAQPSSGYGVAGDGGVGRSYTIADGSTSVYYGGGGGGSGNTPASGGLGGGGDGGGSGEAGTANTGGGGGGAYNTGTAGVGGTGVVILSYNADSQAPANLTLISNSQTAQADPTEGRLMIYEEASTGTITLDTDLKGYVSRDNGTTYTQTTLTLDTTYETGKTLVSGSADISGQPSGTSMKYKIETLNQSASKVCRLHGASLIWA